MDSSNGKERFEILSFIAEKSGGYVLEIGGFDEKTEKGIYTVCREPSRTANAVTPLAHSNYYSSVMLIGNCRQ